ncbi:MAG: hypothetical protein WEC59_03290 [Salibacteraceae bacterium]
MICSQENQLKAHSASLYALAKGRTVNTVFTAGADRVVAEWNLNAQEPNPFAIRVESTVYSLLTIDRQRLIIGTGVGGIHTIDLLSKKEIKHLKLHNKGIFHLHHDTVNHRIYSSSADGTVSVWDAESWELLWHLQCTDQKVRRTTTNPDGSLAAICCGDGRCLVLETQQHRIIQELDAHADSCNAAAFTADGQLLTGGKDAHLKRWDIKNGFQLKKAIPAHNFAIYDIVVAPNSNWIATASRDKTIKIWDHDLEEKPVRLDRKSHDGHINSVNGMIFLEDENRLVSCSDDRSAIIWRID